MTRKTLKRTLMLSLIGIVAMLVFSDVVSKPFTFSAGDVISSSEVNENFDVLYTRLNSLIEEVEGLPLGNWTESGGNVNRSSGNVGIGTTTPGYLLDVNGTINAGTIRLGGVERSSWPASQWSDGTGGSIYYDSGNVGIGVANPTIAKLDVKSDDTSWIAKFENSTGSGNGVGIWGGGTTGNVLDVNDSAGNDVLTVKADNLVGIGTSSPGYSLTISDGSNERMNFSASPNPANPNAGTVVIYFDGTNLLAKNSSGNTVALTNW